MLGESSTVELHREVKMLATIVISLILILIIALAISSIVCDRKQGKSICGGNCGHCPAGGTCHQFEKIGDIKIPKK